MTASISELKLSNDLLQCTLHTYDKENQDSYLYYVTFQKAYENTLTANTTEIMNHWRNYEKQMLGLCKNVVFLIALFQL